MAKRTWDGCLQPFEELSGGRGIRFVFQKSKTQGCRWNLFSNQWRKYFIIECCTVNQTNSGGQLLSRSLPLARVLWGAFLCWGHVPIWSPSWPLILQFLSHWKLEPVWHLLHFSVTPWFTKVTEAFHFFMLPGLSSETVNSMQNVHVYREGDLGDMTVIPRAHMLSNTANTLLRKPEL